MAIKTRIQSKNGTEAEWDLATNFIPLKGEVVIYNTDEENIFPRIKIGDGETPVTQLPFANEEISDSEIDEICGVITISSVLAENSWDVIQKAARDGTAKNYWNVGDRVGIELNGTVGIQTFSNETYYAYILGFDHNPDFEEAGIHFQFGFTAASGGVHVAFCDSTYGSSSSSACFHMNSSNTNSGGWKDSYMRNTICSQFLSALPTALQNVIASTTKYTDNTGGGSNTASYVTATSDKIFLLAEYEIFGEGYGYSGSGFANDAEKNYQEQYTYYANGNSKVMYKSNATSTACHWLERSPGCDISSIFCCVYNNGSAYPYNAHYSGGFAPGFRVG